MTSHQTKCTLAFHGAAGNSCPHSLCWTRCPRRAALADVDSNSSGTGASVAADATTEDETDVLIYPSSGVLNLCTTTHSNSTPLTTVTRTLISRTELYKSEGENKRVLARGEAVEDAAALRSVTAIDWVDSKGDSGNSFGVVASFSDGTVTSWRYDGSWRELVLIGNDPSSSSKVHLHDSVSCLQESIADVTAIALNNSSWIVGTASSSGTVLCLSHVSEENMESTWIRQISNHPAASIHIVQPAGNNECMILAGSASPRHNKVWVYTLASNANVEAGEGWVTLPTLTVEEPTYQGHLLGHQDWITCFAWLNISNSNDDGRGKSDALLASSGHDAKIRLWKFTSLRTNSNAMSLDANEATDDENSNSGSSAEEEDEANIDDLEEEEGEARLIVKHSQTYPYNTTVVSLEALLLGHEEAITSLTWRNSTNESTKPCLLSSSMDRTILLWMEESYEQDCTTSGVWVPISRVGAAGGILGGSIGASLMGFVGATFSSGSDRIVGHGYGGSLHFWSRVNNDDPAEDSGSMEQDREDDVLLSARWLADPCITGHFRPVQDLAWDPNGEYLLTTGADQTTRLWAEVPTTDPSSCRWMEVGRPQVHGYDMTSIACIGGHGDENGEPRHRFVSGADEKVLRVFDAPVSTLRLLSSLKRMRKSDVKEDGSGNSWRVERAFLPSLGLSNKATADLEQESAKYAGPTNDDDFVNSLNTIEANTVHEVKLPSERDLGVTTLWPETRKLFGHDSELVCLDAYRAPVGSKHPTLVASSCKARNDAAGAAIRVWCIKLGKCLGVLKGGHRSTASTLSFSKDGKFLASSGKDRRICIWKRQDDSSYHLAAAMDSAHKRIVWSVHFCPSRPNILASASRDGLVKVWRISDDGSDTKFEEILSFEPTCKAGKKSEPVTAVSFAEMVQPDLAVLAIGTESGHIEVWAVDLGGDESTRATLLHSISSDNSHFYTVNKIAWRPLTTDGRVLVGNDVAINLTLASCGQDCGVRIFHFTLGRTTMC